MTDGIKVSKEQFRFMRIVEKKNEYVFNISDMNMVLYLCQKGLLIQYTKSSNLNYCKLTELGKAYLYSHKIENRFRYLPIAISAFAAIGGFRKEISAILQIITKLAKTLMGD